MENAIFFSTVLNMCLLVVLAYLLTRNRYVRRILYFSKPGELPEGKGARRRDLLLKLGLGVVMGIFCMISNEVGFLTRGAIPNSRVIGAMASGMLGGPIAGMTASVMGALHRYLGDPGRVSTPACVLATLIQGMMGSGLWLLNERRTDYSKKCLYVSTAVAETMHMMLIYWMIADKAAALEILNNIAFPMVLVNPFGMIILFVILRDAARQDDEAAAAVVARSFRASEQCIPYLRVNGSIEEERSDVAHVLEIIMNEKIYDGAAVICSGFFLGRTAAFAPLQDGLEECPEIIQAAEASETAVWREEGAKDVFAPLYRNYRVIAVGVHMHPEPEVKDYLLLLVRKNGYFSEVALTYADSLAHFITTQYQLSLLEEQRAMLQRAELQTLQSQINPHFLFNALNTISYFCREKPEKARELLLALSRYFRNTLQSVDAMTTLEKELDHVRSYLMLEEARFEERLKVIIETDPKALELQVPNLILQPLVENAVKHGAMTQAMGQIKIRIFREEDFVRIQVLDNGPGVPEEVIAGLESGIKTRGGLGMTNVHRRLMVIWGKSAGLHCCRIDGWNCVETRIPVGKPAINAKEETV